jgi:hypothetical protein
MEVSGQHHVLAAVSLGKNSGTYCLGGWVGPIVDVDDLEKPWPASEARIIHSVA